MDEGDLIGSLPWFVEALAAVDDPTPGYDDLKKLTEPQRHQGRSYAGFNPAREEEVRLFAAVLAGDHIAQGFRNRDIRAALHSESGHDPLRARHSAAVGRLLKRMQVRGLVVKVPRSRRWRGSVEGIAPVIPFRRVGVRRFRLCR